MKRIRMVLSPKMAEWVASDAAYHAEEARSSSSRRRWYAIARAARAALAKVGA